MKAGFLYNFAKYVHWPEASFSDPRDPFSIGVIGQDPFGTTLERALVGKTLQDHPIEIRRFADVGALRPCHILFVPHSEIPRLQLILDRVRSWAILTVGEARGFCGSGGIVSILIEDGKPELEVNPQAASKVGLVVDARLLKLASIVSGE